MPTTRNGEVELYYDTFGDRAQPTLLLINGLGSQCINYADEWCERFVAEGYHVVRFDNRDVGLSTKCDDIDYTVHDMALDAVAVLDAVGAERAHVMGCSMGGMIVQRLATNHPDRLLSATSVMSGTGEPDHGQSAPEALAFLTAPPAESREAYIDNHVAGQHVYGSNPEWLDDDLLLARAAAAYDRCFCPDGVRRQMLSVLKDTGRAEALRAVELPFLVMHGSRDRLIDPSGGRRTAEVVPGARYVEIEGMGHDYPPAVWDTWVASWAEFAGAAATPA